LDTNNYGIDIFNLNWTQNGDSVDFIFTVNVTSSNNAWAAFALSVDDEMVK
jgi:hypothetical protein